MVADKGYDSDELRHYCDRHRMTPVIGNRNMHRKPRPGLPRGFDKPKYRQRNIIERHFGWVKELRRICTRFDKLASSFRAMVCLACIDLATFRHTRQYVISMNQIVPHAGKRGGLRIRQ